MKTTGHLVFYISENEDFELWRALSQIPSEERSAFVKEALRSAILQPNDAQTDMRTSIHRQPVNGNRPNTLLRFDRSAGSRDGGSSGSQYTPVSDLAMDELGYDAITEADDKVLLNIHRPIEDDLEDTRIEELIHVSESRSKNTLPGLDFLLTNVIGEEDDENVIEFFRKNQTAAGEEE
ncbi:hypothetical protein LPY66_08340 [Dehalobacter sp. DCM]|uniref:hypothetical protein n=1 Tax=Dehalobacter sp. DCM TaxID=2907827 RepID=UPI00308211B5|nr:hypothetical protein LPY66_08340 [Dehalobacter sp. DCM]